MFAKQSTIKTKKQEAITLIALIVTILILMILAGVGISMLTRRKWNTF